MDERFLRAIAAIDAANAADPNALMVVGVRVPKELAHARMLTVWVERLLSGPSEAVLLAARGHHIRRWEHPRSEHEPGRRGYLRWRTALYAFHAKTTGEILRGCGYGEDVIQRVETLIAKKAAPGDPDGQALEDGLCLVFLETQFDDLAGKVDRETMISVLQKSWRKMSPAGRAAALALAVPERERTLIGEALGMDTPTFAPSEE